MSGQTPPLSAIASADLDTGVITVVLDGELTLTSVPTVRQVLLKAFAQAPDAVIVDLARMTAHRKALLSVFPTAVRIHGLPSVALLLCGADPAVAALMSGRILGDVPVYPTVADAIAAVAWAQRHAAQRRAVRLAPTVDAPAVARRIVEDACTEWDLHPIETAALTVTSELVANAVEHAGTDIRLTVARRGDFLHINVRDASPLPAVMPPGDLAAAVDDDRGRGLRLIDIYATGWGCHTAADGKIVWATLRIAPVRGDL